MLLCLPLSLLLLLLHSFSKVLHRCFIAGLLSHPILVCSTWLEVANTDSCFDLAFGDTPKQTAGQGAQTGRIDFISPAQLASTVQLTKISS